MKINWGVIIAVIGTSLQALGIAVAVSASAAQTQTDIAVLKSQVAAISKVQDENSKAMGVLVDRFVAAGFANNFTWQRK